MGVVYEAEQTSLRRRVALKVLPFAAAVEPRRLQRFKTEALAAAHVQDEKIVPVYAVGCERGVHYYAMQFIEGQSLAELIAELRRLRQEQDRERSDQQRNDFEQELVPDRTMGLLGSRLGQGTATTISRELSSDRRSYFERMAGLGRQAALALEHAHQSGIVHRDVKPGNLLLDLRGELWVTDFGLAQVSGNAGLTMTGELLGTLRYVSPEQLLAKRGIVDHRSDIYSLGATLYELLTLKALFDSSDRNTLIKQIADDDPTPPCYLDGSIPHDLETIVLKALRKQPFDRYSTAQEMACDLERFLDGRPILARPPTPSERLRSWSQRNPAVVGSGVVALILLSIASLVSTALVRREQGKTLVEKQRAEAAFSRERRRAEEAEARFLLARSAVDELIRVSEEELAHRPGMEGLRKRILGAALDYYRVFIEQRSSDPNSQADLRDSTRRVETILADLAVLRAAGDLYLVIQPSALDDLQLDQPQRAKVAQLSARAGKWWMENFGDLGRLPPPTKRLKIALEQARANEAELDLILTPAQRLRLRQIALQSEGSGAFREPEVVETLALTSEQRQRIRAIEEEMLLAQTSEIRSGKAPGELADPSMDQILSVLTLEQARRWRELTGDPIKGRLSVFPMPFKTRREQKQPL